MTVNQANIQTKDQRWVIRDGVVQIWERGPHKPGLTASFQATQENFRSELRAHRVAKDNWEAHRKMVDLVRSARNAWQAEMGIIPAPPQQPLSRPVSLKRADDSSNWDTVTFMGFGIGMYQLR